MTFPLWIPPQIQLLVLYVYVRAQGESGLSHGQVGVWDEGEALGYSQTLGELEHPRMCKYIQSEDKVKGEQSRPRVHQQTWSHLDTGG